ncbi:MAG: hypothetical protein A3K76_04325 [Euryarchaeota archaeon RBG_13_57_23]|nr:MAG: hypothetical protein A3K76_04325 [Euryarchaeota archaeon RBG_13_57_23]
MAEQVKRRLKGKGESEKIASAAPLEAAKKIRRVRKVVPPQGGVPIPPQEPQKEAPPVAESPKPEAPAEDLDEFMCMKCGCTLKAHTTECPICGERYIDLPKDALDELEKAEKDSSTTLDEVVDKDEQNAPCIMFDAAEGVVDFIEKDARAFEVALICSECGTALEFATDTCPICGTAMENPDAGLAGLASELSFEEYASEEIDCPQCGEKVKLAKGKCPVCKTVVMRSDPHGILRKLDPVIHGDNVIFLHLDVKSGELNYLQRAVKKEGFEKMTIRLEAT